VYLRILESVTAKFAEYIICSIGGDKVECNELRNRLYDAVTAPATLNWIANTLGLFVGIVNLNLIFNYSDVKKAIAHLVNSLKHSS